MHIYSEIIGVTQVSHIKVGVLTVYGGQQIHGLFNRLGAAVYRSRQRLAHSCA